MEGAGISILNLKKPLFNIYPKDVQTNTEGAILMVKSIYAEGDSIYIGTFSEGIHIISKSSQKGRKIPGIVYNGVEPVKSVFVLKRDAQNRLWLNVGGMIGYVQRGSMQFIKSTFIPYHSVNKTQNAIYCFAQISDSLFAVGTFRTIYLLQIQKNGSIKQIDIGEKNRLLQGYIHTILVNNDKEIIIGKNQEGYVRFELTDTHDIKIIDTGLATLTIKYIYEDVQRNAYWYCTDAGLIVQYKNQQKQIVIDVKDGLSNDFVYSLLPENTNTFWISTNKGLNKIILKNQQTIAVASVEQFTVKNGLQSNEFNTGAFFKDGQDFYFGGVTGINWFSATQFMNRSFNAPVYITSLLVNDKPVASDTAINYIKNLNLRYDQNNLLVKFAALNFTNPSGIRYAYMLKGYDNGWVYSDNVREARYTHLPDGKYVFIIKAANDEGVWGTAQELLQLAIRPPFWKTWWFMIASTIVLVVILYLIVRYIIKRKLEQQRIEIDKEIAVNSERQRISKDMHDELGTGLSKITLLSEVSKHKIKSSPEGDKIISEISKTSRGLAEKMGEIIWTLNSKNDTLDNLAAYLKEYISEHTEHLPVRVQFAYPETIPAAPVTNLMRQQILMVTKEVLNNTLKYANAANIIFTLSCRNHQLLFSFADDGKGFDAAMITDSRNGRKNGLVNMQQRMDSINGYLVIFSKPGAGTKITYGTNL